VSFEPRKRSVEGITILPFREFLEALWAGEYSWYTNYQKLEFRRRRWKNALFRIRKSK